MEYQPDPRAVPLSDPSFRERYQAAYDAQPISAQMFELQSQVRGIWMALVQIKEGMEGSPVSEECGRYLDELIAAMEELERLADGLVDTETSNAK